MMMLCSSTHRSIARPMRGGITEGVVDAFADVSAEAAGDEGRLNRAAASMT